MAAQSSVVPYEEKRVRKPNVTDIIPPVDYSFLHLTAIDECESEQPRQTSPRKPAAFKTKTAPAEDGFEKSQSQCIRLNNNQLKDVNNLMNIATHLFESPYNIGWIDLSFNFLTHVDPILTQFENLKILYLHGNQIADIKEVNKLGTLTKLWKLTLHGNEIENTPGYRLYVLSAVPTLINFDFSRVTKGDRATATAWKKFNSPDKSKKIQRLD